MPDDPTPAPAPPTSPVPSPPPAQGGPAPVDAAPGERLFTQEQVNAFQAETKRLVTERFADYDALKAKAARLEAIEEADKKTAGRIAALESELAAQKVATMRARVQARHGIGDEDAELFLTGADEETLTRQAQRLAERASGSSGLRPVKHGLVIPTVGKPPPPSAPSEELAAVRALFGAGDATT